jgi:hypothetical protein
VGSFSAKGWGGGLAQHTPDLGPEEGGSQVLAVLVTDG